MASPAPLLVERGSRRWWILAAALLVQATVSATILGFPALVPFVRADLHLSVAQAGLFATIPAAGSFFMLTTIGWAVDRFGDRVVLVAGGIGTGILTALASLAASYPVLLLLLTLVGVGSATPTPAGSSAIMQEFDASERGVMMSVRQTGIPIGGALAAFTLPSLTVAFGWRFALVAAALACVAGALAALLLYSRSGGDGGGRGGTPAVRGLSGVPLREVFLAGASGGVLAAAQFCVLSFLVLYLHSTWRVPLVAGSLLLAFVQLVGAASRIFWGWLSGRLFGSSRTRTLVAVSLLGALIVVLFAALPSGVAGIVVGLVALALGGCALGWNGVYITLLAELAEPGFQGRSIGVGMTVSQVGIVFGPALFGLLVDVTGSFRLVWVLLAAALVGAALLAAAVRERAAAERS